MDPLLINFAFGKQTQTLQQRTLADRSPPIFAQGSPTALSEFL
jgi:hypothetical protein